MNAPQRRAAFQRLISLAQSSNPAFKKLVTEKVKEFFDDFPDLQEEAINAVYDLCEDQDQSVRSSHLRTDLMLKHHEYRSVSSVMVPSRRSLEWPRPGCYEMRMF